MAVSITKENFFWHKVQSITGIVPIGYYVVQHLVLNSFSIAGPDKFNGVIAFFDSLPLHFLLVLEICFIWVPILFHALYGLVIIGHAQYNYPSAKYGFSQNRMYTFQRISGMFLFLFLIYHVLSTTGLKYLTHNSTPIQFQGWHDKLTSAGGVWLAVYLLGVLAASYHLSYGVWNFCIRWGITISERAQQKVQSFSLGMFVVVTLIGWAALGGFLIKHTEAESIPTSTTPTSLPIGTGHGLPAS
jgi:succinate dehydrogenase / fumarate reductase cytochrome b subunit